MPRADQLMDQMMAMLGDGEEADAMRASVREEALAERAERERQCGIARAALANPAGAAFLALIQQKLRQPVSREGLTLEQYALAAAERNGQTALLSLIFDMLGAGAGPQGSTQ